MDDEVIVGIGWVAGAGFVGFEWAVGDGEMVGVDVLFSFEFECGHGQFLWFGALYGGSGSIAGNKFLTVNIWLALSSIKGGKARHNILYERG